MSEKAILQMFGELCRLPDVAAGVAAMSDASLRALLGWLARENAVDGIPGMIRGVALVEAAERFMKGGSK